MPKKINPSILLLCAVLFFTMTTECFADASALLEQAKSNITSLIREGNFVEAELQTQELITDFSGNKQVAEVIHEIAQQYQLSGKLVKAIELSQYALDNWPQTPSAIWLQMRIAVCNIALGDDCMAQEVISTLTSDYSQDPHLPMTLYILAEQYRLSKKYEEARSIYQQIKQNHPYSRYASQLEFGDSIAEVMLLIESQDYELAEEVLDELTARFSEHEGFPYAVCMIAKKYNEVGEKEKAFQLHQYNVENFPHDMYAMWSQVEITYYHIRDANDAAADVAFNKLLTVFYGQPTLPKEIYQVANEFHKAQRYDKANQLYPYVIENCSEDDSVVLSRAGVARVNIAFGDEAAAKAILDSLIADFNDHPDLPEAIFLIGEEYYYKAMNDANEGLTDQAEPNFAKAASVWDRIITQLPNPKLTVLQDAHYFAGYCYRRLGNYEKAIEYYQKIVDDYPDYRYAWHAQLRIAYNYQRLQNAGGISDSEAEPKIIQAYEAVVENYPGCKLAHLACIRLAWLHFYKEQWAEAANYFELFIEKTPDSQQALNVLCPLSDVYEKLGQTELATEMCRAYINMAGPDGRHLKWAETRLKKLTEQADDK